MKRLLKHEFFKVLNSLTIKILLIVVAGFAIINELSLILLIEFAASAVGEEGGMLSGIFFQGSQSMMASFDFLNLAIVMAIAIAVVTTYEYNSGSIKNTLLSDQTRITIYIAKYIVIITIITALVFINAFFQCGISLIAYGWGGIFSFQSLWSNYILILLLGLLLCYALAAMISFVAYATKNTVLTIVTIFGISVVIAIFSMIGMAGIRFFEWISQFSFTSVLSTYYISKEPIDLLYYFITVAALFVPFFIGGLLVFKKQEIK